ncbi:PaaI family thioesterase [Blastochloris sulfoviridis]|uniref:PaaI family thioesterase n=1 Tax=Blastochloris sulfoviridis TaxID=50712 RepID=UPI001AEDD8EC|nr:PaaI family thioesterase [Blastochloris sulfoviridis]
MTTSPDPVPAPQPLTAGTVPSHAGCLLCGDRNPLSLKLRFAPDGADGVQGSFACRDILQGYDGMVHGGVIAALLDCAMTHCLFHHDIEAVTADLHIRYRLPLSCRARVDLRARFVQFHPPLYRLTAEIKVGDQLVARAAGAFVDAARRPAPVGSGT